METETSGLTYRYTFGFEKISAVLSLVDVSAGNIVQNGTVKLYFHRDRLGNTDYLSDNVQGKMVDSKGNRIEFTNATVHAKSNVEVCGGVKIVVYPQLESIDALLGWGLNAGVEIGAFEFGGYAIDFANLTPEGVGHSLQGGGMLPIINLPVDVYVGVGYTSEMQRRELTDEEWDRLNNIMMGGL